MEMSTRLFLAQMTMLTGVSINETLERVLDSEVSNNKNVQTEEEKSKALAKAEAKRERKRLNKEKQIHGHRTNLIIMDDMKNTEKE